MCSIKTIIKINNIYTYIIDNLKIFSIMKLLFTVAIISQFVLNISVSNNFVSIFFNLNLFFIISIFLFRRVNLESPTKCSWMFIGKISNLVESLLGFSGI